MALVVIEKAVDHRYNVDLECWIPLAIIDSLYQRTKEMNNFYQLLLQSYSFFWWESYALWDSIMLSLRAMRALKRLRNRHITNHALYQRVSTNESRVYRCEVIRRTTVSESERAWQLLLSEWIFSTSEIDMFPSLISSISLQQDRLTPSSDWEATLHSSSYTRCCQCCIFQKRLIFVVHRYDPLTWQASFGSRSWSSAGWGILLYVSNNEANFQKLDAFIAIHRINNTIFICFQELIVHSVRERGRKKKMSLSPSANAIEWSLSGEFKGCIPIVCDSLHIIRCRFSVMVFNIKVGLSESTLIVE